MSEHRRCGCDHGFPLCACFEGVSGAELLARSRWLSAIAGWPGRVDRAAADLVVAEHGRRRPVWLELPRVDPGSGHECGCGQGRA